MSVILNLVNHGGQKGNVGSIIPSYYFNPYMCSYIDLTKHRKEMKYMNSELYTIQQIDSTVTTLVLIDSTVTTLVLNNADYIILHSVSDFPVLVALLKRSIAMFIPCHKLVSCPWLPGVHAAL